MVVKAIPAIGFKCVGCGLEQYGPDTLEDRRVNRVKVLADTIDCSKCGRPNLVIRERT